MAKYKQNGKKSERISLRCTKMEKERLLKRASALEMDPTEYIRNILFSQGSYENVAGSGMELMIDIQDLIVHIIDFYKEDCIQEEADRIWRKIKELS